MNDINKIFKIPQKVEHSFSELRKNPDAIEDYDVKKSIQTKEIVTGDHNSNGLRPEVVNFIYGTSATPPTANTVPIGTIYIQYTE